MGKISFNNKNATFFKSLTEETDSYFSSQKLLKTGNWRLYAKTVILIFSAISIYLLVLVIPMPILYTTVLGLALGFISACIGFNVMHDANHGSYSSKKWINETLGLTLNALGGNSFIWKYKHNVIHHTYTNVDGMDDDIAKSPFIRMCETQRWVPAHRYQHFYTPFLYAVSSAFWVLFQDFEKYFKPKLNNVSISEKMPLKDHLIFWVSKLLYVLFYLLIPAMLIGWLPCVVFFIALHIGLGLTLAIVFQLAHVVDITHFEFTTPGETKRIDDEWAIHQLKTTANFSPSNPVITWLAGGLNYQVEHHLFPRVSHIHYPMLSKIVRSKCQEFGLPYHSIPSLGKAVTAHFRYLKVMGNKPSIIY
jgi:linoleoyl-CoA desaturase